MTLPHLLIQFCNDDTGSYPRPDFQGANQVITNLQQAVTANQQGITLYATAITSDTFNPVNTLDPAFTVPAFPAYPPQPTPVPTQAPQNPVSDPATATAVSHQTTSNFTAYNQAVAALEQQIASARATMTTDTQPLMSWNPPVDFVTSVLGCFQLAASRFAGKSDKKLIYIHFGSSKQHEDVDYTQSFVTNHSLAGVMVFHVIFFYAENAQTSTQIKHDWCAYLSPLERAPCCLMIPLRRRRC